VTQRNIGMGSELIRPLDLVQCSHRLSNGGGEVDEVARHRRIGLQSVESARERLACRA
jgi:hypothetical protein